jgi:hypothetical protein
MTDRVQRTKGNYKEQKPILRLRRKMTTEKPKTKTKAKKVGLGSGRSSSSIPLGVS